MCKICIFSGTTEGRKLVSLLGGQAVLVTVCVATDYARELTEPAENVTVLAQRLDAAQMEALFLRERFLLVVDATHPYAQEVSENVRLACQKTGTEYLRLRREDSFLPQNTVLVGSAAEAAAYLAGTNGAVLLTTGSKEIAAFSQIPDFSSRVFARVLPLEDSIAACRAAGLAPSHILAMQGPFSEEMNAALLHTTQAAYLVTKDGGSAGGFEEKASAAEQCGVTLVVISRPAEEEGRSLHEITELLQQRCHLRLSPRVALVGIGPGAAAQRTTAAQQAIDCAACLIGAERMLVETAHPSQKTVAAIAPTEIADFIKAHPEYRDFAVVLSGDLGFYSGAKKLLPLLADCEVSLHPGISSLSMLCARFGVSYEDVYPLSLHGRSGHIAQCVHRHKKVFALVGGNNGVGQLLKTLCAFGLGDVRVSVGERLSYPDEKCTCGTAETLCDKAFDALGAVLIENDCADEGVSAGLNDALFLRDAAQTPVPMTKSEVRAVCLSKLALCPDAVCWDVGAGTGSVSIEMARLCPSGTVYAIEKKDEALALLVQNRKHFHADNLEIISGRAPDACSELPAPSHVFIGGSSGELKQILALVLSKNPNARIVAAAITLETVAELTACIKEFDFSETEIVSLSVAKGKVAGPYHMMLGQNPVYIFTLQAGGAV